MPLFLIGYMASGKTTFGRALSKKTGLPFIDLDEYIEQTQGLTISEIFRKYNEEGFRNIEKEALNEVCFHQKSIIACGGGTPCFFDNMEVMKEAGTTVYLKASVPVLVKRLREENARRPIVAGKTYSEIEAIVKNQLAMRESYYSLADITCNADKLDTAEEIETTINQFLTNNPFVFSTPFI